MDVCGENGALLNALKQEEDLNFLIFPEQCTPESIQKNLNISEEDWSTTIVNGPILLLRKEHK